MKNIFVRIVVGLLILTQINVVVFASSQMPDWLVDNKINIIVDSVVDKYDVASKISEKVDLKIVENKNVNLNIDFVAQAPFGQWSDVRQAEGCEEASVYMAIHWAMASPVTLEDARNEIINISEFEKNNFGTAHDSSIEDTFNWIVKSYYKNQNSSLLMDVSLDDIKKAISEGNAVIIPVNGYKIGNTNYYALQHTVLIKGYDSLNKQFIVHDPGTRLGGNVRYDENVVFGALENYESGELNYISKRVNGMIVVKPSSHRLSLDF